MPLDDPKNEHCKPLNYVEIFDNDESIGLFRIIPSLTRKLATINEIQYHLEHVITTLLDDVLFQYHQRSNFTTRQNIEYLLSQQTVQNWKLGQCDFTRYFHYSWENENGLLGALFSIAEPFDESYVWTWDTSTYPWTINLVKPSSAITCEIRYAKNLLEIEREVDAANIVNRIYPLGAGEGVNQLTIKKVNANSEYLEDSASIANYGLKSYVWVDRRFTDAESLKANAQAKLDEWSVPKVTYRVKAADISSITGASIDELREGKLVRIIDPDVGTFEARIVTEAKADIVGAPGDIELEIANKTETIGTTIADIERRQEINEVYSQGATNIDSREFNDNADATHPAIIRFYLPEDVVHINQMLLSWQTSKFRAHSRSIKGGGAYVKGSTVQSKSTASGGGTTATSSSGGGVSKSTASGGSSTRTSSAAINWMDGIPAMITGTEIMETGGTHYHLIPGISNLGNHTHSVQVPAHTHSFETPDHTHNVTIQPHTHNFEVEIPAINIPAHTHDIEFGIFELPETPTSVTITVDGKSVPVTATSRENFDLIPYLTDANGMIPRGKWIEITIKPNRLGRITASLTSRLFIRSQIGGNY